MDVTGVVLGGISLVLDAVGHYEKGSQILKDLSSENITKDLRILIFMQKEQLELTLANIGLVNPSPEELLDRIKTCYPGKHDEWTAESSERARWEWHRVKRSFKRHKVQKIADDLQKWNNALQMCFEKSEIPLRANDNSPLLARIRSRIDAKRCSRLRKNARLVYDVVSDACKYNCSASHCGNLKLLWHKGNQLESDRIHMSLSRCSFTNPFDATSWQDFDVEIQDLEQSARLQMPSPSVSRYQLRSHARKVDSTKTVRFGFTGPGGSMRLPNTIPSMSAGVPSSTPLSSLPSSLCHFLRNSSSPRHFEVSKPAEKLCIIIKSENTSNPQRKAAALRSLFVQGNAPTLLKTIPKADRLAVCAGISWAVLLLSGSPWLSANHGWVNDINVLCNNSSPDVYCPTLSGLLGKTSQTQLDSRQIDAYKIQNSHLKNETLFTLGILLIELSLGISLEDLRKQKRGPSSARSPSDDYEIANEHVQAVYNEVGRSDGDAVQRCIKCSFPGHDATHSFEFERFCLDFFTEVVVPIQATYEQMLPLF
ncbi:hypothetical protein F5B20DRAFT_587100 [Whalleya microplaca]|nr:hypothetical protein F5B20DRAFT_587100 [Whalleya microplaca]